MRFENLVVLDENTFSEEQVESLKGLATKVKVYKDNPKDKQEIKKRISDADALIVCWTSLDKEMIDMAKKLKYLGLLATGWHWLDAPYAISKGITVTNTPGYATEAVAEIVFGQLITLMRHTREADKSVRQGKFVQEPFLGEELKGKTIGIIGLGNIGQRVAEIAEAFGMNVTYWSKHKKEEFERAGMKYVELDMLLRDSDIVSLHLATVPETKIFFDEDKFSKMKEGAVFVNMASGEVVDEEALIKYIAEGKVRAILDVFQKHRPKEEFIMNRDILLTPEIGFYTREALNRMNEIAIENAKAFTEGGPKNVIKI